MQKNWEPSFEFTPQKAITDRPPKMDLKHQLSKEQQEFFTEEQSQQILGHSPISSQDFTNQLGQFHSIKPQEKQTPFDIDEDYKEYKQDWSKDFFKPEPQSIEQINQLDKQSPRSSKVSSNTLDQQKQKKSVTSSSPNKGKNPFDSGEEDSSQQNASQHRHTGSTPSVSKPKATFSFDDFFDVNNPVVQQATNFGTALEVYNQKAQLETKDEIKKSQDVQPEQQKDFIKSTNFEFNPKQTLQEPQQIEQNFSNFDFNNFGLKIDEQKSSQQSLTNDYNFEKFGFKMEEIPDNKLEDSKKNLDPFMVNKGDGLDGFDFHFGGEVDFERYAQQDPMDMQFQQKSDNPQKQTFNFDNFQQVPIHLNEQIVQQPRTERQVTQELEGQSVKKSDKSKQEFNFDDFGDVDVDDMNKSDAGEDSREEFEKYIGVKQPQTFDRASQASRNIADIEEMMHQKELQPQPSVEKQDNQNSSQKELPKVDENQESGQTTPALTKSNVFTPIPASEMIQYIDANQMANDPLSRQLQYPKGPVAPFQDFPFLEIVSPVPVMYDRFNFDMSGKEFQLDDWKDKHSQVFQPPVTEFEQEINGADKQDAQNMIGNKIPEQIITYPLVSEEIKMQPLVKQQEYKPLAIELKPILEEKPIQETQLEQRQVQKFTDELIPTQHTSQIVPVKAVEVIQQAKVTKNPFESDIDDEVELPKQVYSIQDFLENQLNERERPERKLKMPTILESDEPEQPTPSVQLLSRPSFLYKSQSIQEKQIDNFDLADEEKPLHLIDSNKFKKPPQQNNLEKEVEQLFNVFQQPQQQQTDPDQLDQSFKSVESFDEPNIQREGFSLARQEQSQTPIVEQTKHESYQIQEPKKAEVEIKTNELLKIKEPADPFQVIEPQQVQEPRQIISQADIQAKNQIQEEQLNNLIDKILPSIVNQVRLSVEHMVQPSPDKKAMQMFEQKLEQFSQPITQQFQRVQDLERQFNQLSQSVQLGYTKICQAIVKQQDQNEQHLQAPSHESNIMPLVQAISRELSDVKRELEISRQDFRLSQVQQQPDLQSSQLMLKIDQIEEKMEQSNAQLVKLNERYDHLLQEKQQSLLYSSDKRIDQFLSSQGQKNNHAPQFTQPASPLDDFNAQFNELEEQNKLLYQPAYPSQYYQGSQIKPFLSNSHQYQPVSAGKASLINSKIQGRSSNINPEEGFDKTVMRLKTQGVYVSKYIHQPDQIQIFKRMCLQDNCTILDTFELFISCKYESVDLDSDQPQSVVKLTVTYRNKSHVEMKHLVVIVNTQQVTDRFYCDPLKVSRAKLGPDETVKQEFVFYEFNPNAQTLSCAVGYMLNYMRRSFTIQLARPVTRFIQSNFLGIEDLQNLLNSCSLVQSDSFTIGGNLKQVTDLLVPFPWLIEMQEKEQLKEIAALCTLTVQGKQVELLLRFQENNYKKCVVQLAFQKNGDIKLAESILSYFAFVAGQ